VDYLKNNEILFSGKNFWMISMCAQEHCHVEEKSIVMLKKLAVFPHRFCSFLVHCFL